MGQLTYQICFYCMNPPEPLGPLVTAFQVLQKWEQNLGEATFRYHSPRLWNSLPEDLRGLENVDTLAWLLAEFYLFIGSYSS